VSKNRDNYKKGLLGEEGVNVKKIKKGEDACLGGKTREVGNFKYINYLARIIP
jgi:hypothetical protein